MKTSEPLRKMFSFILCSRKENCSFVVEIIYFLYENSNYFFFCHKIRSFPPSALSGFWGRSLSDCGYHVILSFWSNWSLVEEKLKPVMFQVAEEQTRPV